MVIRLVAHGNAFLLKLPPAFSVNVLSHRGGGRHRVLPEDLTQVVEQSGGRQGHIGPARLIEVLRKEVGILVSLFRRFIEIRPGLLPLLFDTLPGEVQLSQAVGSAGVALRRRFSIPGYRLAHLVLTFQKFPQCVLCEVISCVSRPLIVWENTAPVCAAFCGARRPSTT